MPVEKDPVTGTDLTGHEWDGIKELNTPVPRVSTWALGLTAATAVLFWILYPAWPYVSDYSRGVLGYSSRAEVLKAVAEGDAVRAGKFVAFTREDVTTLVADPILEERFSGSISKLYADNCAACHGRDLTGQTGFPDLTDSAWIWPGAPEEIELTIRHGINARDDDTRISQMLAFGRDEMLDRTQIADVTEFVLFLSGADHDMAAAARGDEIFADNCTSCHADNGRGDPDLGAPDLGDDVWLYSGTRQAIFETLQNGRQGVMPAWAGRLTDAEIRMLTLYVLWAGDDRQN